MSNGEKIEVARQGNAAVLQAPAYINADGGAAIAESWASLKADGVLGVVLNMAKCTIANSVGISFLIEVLEEVKEAGGKLAFCCVRPTTAKSFQIMGLLQTATLHDTEDEAVATVG